MRAPPSPAPPSRLLRRAGSWLAFLAVTFLVPLLFVEIGFRLFAPQRAASLPASEWHPVYGWRNRPGAHGFWRTQEYEMDVRINSLGMRYRETTRAKPAGTFRILGLGDSFTFGHGVAADSGFLAVLERELAARSAAAGAPGVQVLNGGVNKWGTAQEYLYFTHEGRGLEPDAVVLAFCVDNDFENNREQSVLRLEGDRLVAVPDPEPSVRRMQRLTRLVPGYELLAAHSHLFNFVRWHAARLEERMRAARAARQASGASPASAAPAAAPTSPLAITTRIVDALVDATRSARVPLLVLFIPSRCQCAPGGWQAVPGCSDPGSHAEMVTCLVAHLDSLAVPVCYPVETLRDASRSRQLYFSEGHLNGEGNRVLGLALAEALARAGLTPEGACRPR